MITVGTGLWIAGFGLVCLLGLALRGAEAGDREQEERLLAERDVVVTTDAPFTHEDMQALHVLLDRYGDGEELFQAIVGQVAEDAADEETEAFLGEVLGDEA